ncbi:MAG: hypothetical protein QCI82_12315, partial [Candidatus Thermoplasmatota archaeon]|nr:hypothetical protein [Candidatus Thermoplasmatota archaeon]
MNKKGIATFFFILAMVLSAIPLKGSIVADAMNGSFGGGSGTVSDPYIIEDVWDLQNMSANLSAHYKLRNVIDASDTINWNSGAGFDPVGTFVKSFTGTFDGCKFTITGLCINRPSTDHVGLFGIIGSGGVVKNVGLIDNDVDGA